MIQEMDEKKYAKIFNKIESFILQEMSTFNIPTVGIALVKDKDIIWQRGFGWQDSDHTIKASSDTVFRVGSISKLFTAIAIMQLHEKRQLNIDTPIVEYCPELTFINNFKSNNPITLRHLLSHRAGILRESPVGNYFDDTEPDINATVQSILNSELIYYIVFILTIAASVQLVEMIMERFNYDHSHVTASFEGNFITPDKFKVIFKWRGGEQTWDDAEVTEFNFTRVKK